MGDNKVKVRIYGQDYIISGERDEATITEIAAYVDGKMREIGKYFSSAVPGSLAVLSAVNVADELFEAREKIQQMEDEKTQMENESHHYMKMWDEAKKSFMQYKDEASKSAADKAELEEKYRQLEAKCNEFESSYFDLQMENVQLKSRLEKFEE